MADNSILNYIDITSLKITSFVSGQTINIQNIFLSLNIYENLFQGFLTAKLIIIDTTDIIQHFPLIGNEDVEISFKNPKGSIKILNFKIYKVFRDVGTYSGESKKRTLVLFLVSQEGIQNQIIKISKKFSGKPETIIDNILINSLGSTKAFVSEAGSDNIDVYGTFRKPLDLIKLISKMSQSVNYRDYVFYETLSGFNFKTVSGLMDQDIQWNLFPNARTIDKQASYNYIKRFRFDSYFDIIENGNIGLFGNTFYKIDNDNYSIEIEKNTYSDISDKSNFLGTNYNINSTLKTNKSNITTKFFDLEISSYRDIFFKLLSNYNFVVKLNGTTEREIGQIVSLIAPNIDNETNFHKQFNGKWLITEINHRITNDTEYLQTLRLVKNAFYKYDELEEI